MHDRLISLMKKCDYGEENIYSAVLLLKDLKDRAVKNVKRLESKLTLSVSDREQYLDVWVEGEAALILAFNEFEVMLYPFGQGGVDLSAEWQDCHLFVEIARFRGDYKTRVELEKAAERSILVPYGRGEKELDYCAATEIRMPLLMMAIVGPNWIGQPSIACARQLEKEGWM